MILPKSSHGNRSASQCMGSETVGVLGGGLAMNFPFPERSLQSVVTTAINGPAE